MADVTLDRVTKDYEGGVRVLESLDLRVTDAELVALVGPSGCGKSTILKLIAGLEEVTDGTVEIGGRVMNGVGPGERDVAMVFQNYALYPHMTVRDNIAFGLRMRGLGKAARYRQVEEVAGILDLEPYLDRRPSALSGGQRQRVAMGRAMVREPAVFLLDEPLSNLDAKLRVKMRADIAELQKRLAATMVFVTHDQVEAMTMADRVVVLDRGIVQQAGTPMELYRRPANLFVAGFIGSPAVNLLRGELTSFAGRWRLRYGRDGEHLDLGTDVLPAAARELTSLVLGIRPESVHIDSSAHESERVLGRVRLVEVLGDETLVHASVNAAPVSVGGATGDEETEAELSPDEARFVSREHEALAAPELGAVVPMRVDLERLMVFDPATGVRLG